MCSLHGSDTSMRSLSQSSPSSLRQPLKGRCVCKGAGPRETHLDRAFTPEGHLPCYLDLLIGTQLSCLVPLPLVYFFPGTYSRSLPRGLSEGFPH